MPVIRNQKWIETNEYIEITLNEPYWSAWKKYGWTQGVEGFGISGESIDYAITFHKHLRVRVMKYNTYDINPTKLAKEATSNRMYVPRDKKPIYVLPRTAFDRVLAQVQAPIPVEEKPKEEQIGLDFTT